LLDANEIAFSSARLEYSAAAAGTAAEVVGAANYADSSRKKGFLFACKRGIEVNGSTARVLV
jgi:hypothetical protein